MTRPISALVRELQVGPPDDRFVEIDLEVEGAEYGRCLDESQLGLGDAERGDGPEPELDRTVRIVARLRPHLADLVIDQSEPMEFLIGRLWGEDDDLAIADAWRATDVTQEIGDGVAIGYRTKWA